MCEQAELFAETEGRAKSPYLKWKDFLMFNCDVTIHFAPKEELPWTAFIGDWDHLAAECAIMEDNDEMRFGETEREALEHLAAAQKFPLCEEWIQNMKGMK